MTGDATEPVQRSRITLAGLFLAGFVCFAGFTALGIWQVHRLGWKLRLIAQVEQNLAAAPVPGPGPMDWAGITAADAYRRVRVTGVFDHVRETCTLAVTEFGPGCWVMTPLRTTDGWWLLVNRGFVADAQRDPASRSAGQVAGTVTVVGLLRLSEPRGGFLRRNDPAAGRWYSRDVMAIAAARGLPEGQVAPYFVDASESAPGGPVAGLTVVKFRNSHLIYALTWFALAAMVLGAGFRLVLMERRR